MGNDDRPLNPLSFFAPVKLVILSGTPPKDPAGVKLYNQAYELWQNVWAVTLRELDGLPKLHSDQFTRQEIVAGLFTDQECIGLTCFRRANLSVAADRDDSWFIPWPSHILTGLGQTHPHSWANSFFTVHPDYRRSHGSGPLQDHIELSVLLTEVVSMISIDLRADAVFGVTRNNRSVNKLAAYGGAVAVAEKQMHHGVEVDLIAFYPHKLVAARENFSPMIRNLWKKKQQYVPLTINVEKKNAKAA